MLLLLHPPDARHTMRVLHGAELVWCWGRIVLQVLLYGAKGYFLPDGNGEAPLAQALLDGRMLLACLLVLLVLGWGLLEAAAPGTRLPCSCCCCCYRDTAKR
jgi:hypothetical protein